MYDAIVAAAKNADLLSAVDPADIRIEECEGTAWSKNSMMRVCDWLGAIRAVSASEDIFQSQILDPIRTSVRCLSAFRRLAPSTTELDVWIFGVSRQYRYEHYEEDKITAFAVVPELESVMSVRVGADDPDRVSPGFYRIGNVQPIPLVNRLHQTRPTFTKICRKPALEDWNFLKTGFGDQDSLNSSAEMEHFLEVESAQSEQRHHLGAAFILACKITAVREPNIFVQRVRGKETANMAISESLATSGVLGDFALEGKYARVLAVQWYDAGDEGAQKLPETFMVEPISERDALMDEITGHVRVRGSTTVEELESMYGRADLSTAKALSVEGTVSYVHKRSSEDPVADEFLKSSARLKNLRVSFRGDSSLQVRWVDVIDDNRMSARGLATLLKGRAQLRDVLGYVQTHIDDTGEAATDREIADSLGSELDGTKRLLRWLKYLGLAEKKDGRIWSTGAARDALAGAFSDHIAKIEGASDLVSIPELACSAPQSAVVSGLSRPGGEFVPLQDGGRANRLYWLRKGADGSVAAEAERKLRELRRSVLAIARSVSFPVTAKYIAQEALRAGLPISHFVANAAAESLAYHGRFVQSGESWEYTITQRVADFLSDNATAEFTVDAILSGACVAGRDRDLAVEALRSLAQEERTTELSGGIWSCRRSEEQIRSHFKEKLKSAALSMIRSKKNGMDRNMLISRLHRFASDIDSERRLRDHGKSAIDAVAELEAEGMVVNSDGMYRTKT